MRITDRGPFVGDRLIDLTIASAKATGIYRVGTARVRVDVYRTPKPIDTGGRWCVQIGAFTSHRKAKKLKEQLLHKYPERQRDRVSRRRQLLGAHPSRGRQPRTGRATSPAACAPPRARPFSRGWTEGAFIFHWSKIIRYGLFFG